MAKLCLCCASLIPFLLTAKSCAKSTKSLHLQVDFLRPALVLASFCSSLIGKYCSKTRAGESERVTTYHNFLPRTYDRQEFHATPWNPQLSNSNPTKWKWGCECLEVGGHRSVYTCHNYKPGWLALCSPGLASPAAYHRQCQQAPKECHIRCT